MDLSKESTEKLGKDQAKFQNVLIAFVVVGLILAGVLIMLKAKFIHFVPLLVLPATFLPLVAKLKAIKTELKSRAKV
ncbi:hypothetical protein [Chitinophaga barathri]|uniref:Redox-active disulfide protein 2 n=1 Tax=Chitinophaga barathri TaxID=1647451 RepID=A0A3N4MIJ5_9BACT|nr:hypothetical protein [Chitinophaga barathri]RPD39479.1 hypothetical protein EG028_20390 [Chitinophaga barathri]